MRKLNKLTLINQFLQEAHRIEREIKLRHDKKLTLVNKRPEIRFRVIRDSLKSRIIEKIKRDRTISRMMTKLRSSNNSSIASKEFSDDQSYESNESIETGSEDSYEGEMRELKVFINKHRNRQKDHF